LNGVPPTDEIGRSVFSVRRTDATITFNLLRCRWSPFDAVDGSSTGT
jgi:hypothetical protein